MCVFCVKRGERQLRSCRSVTLQHCQFTPSTVAPASSSSSSLSLKINFTHMHVCTYSAYGTLHKGYINFTVFRIGCSLWVCVWALHFKRREHTQTHKHRHRPLDLVPYSNQLARFAARVTLVILAILRLPQWPVTEKPSPRRIHIHQV